jgi:ankyrin repeat protein
MPQPIPTSGDTQPWELSEPPIHLPQNATNEQQNPYTPAQRPLAYPSFFDIAGLYPSQMDDDINRQDHDGRTQLHHSVIRGSMQEVEDLLSLGATINIHDSQGDQPLHYAASRGLKDILRLLLKRGANINAKGRAGMTPLHMALRLPTIFGVLLQAGSDVSAQDNKGDTPLHHALSSSLADAPPKGSRVEKLILSGADVNIRNSAGITPFHMALEKPWLAGDYSASFLVMFLENGALVLEKTADGRLPFDVFLENSDFKWAAFKSSYGRGALPDRKRNLDFKQFIAKGANPNTMLNSGETLLNEALNRGIHNDGRDKELSLLLCNSADVDKVGLHGDYPLHCLLRTQHAYDPRVDIVTEFLRRGANPNQTNHAGESPLMVLLRRSHSFEIYKNISSALLQSGANPIQRNQAGDVPIYIAARNNKGEAQQKILDFLLEKNQLDNGTQRSVQFGESLHDDQDWFDEFYRLYRASSWSSPAHLGASYRFLPADISEQICNRALHLIAQKFFSSAKARFISLKEAHGLWHHDTKAVCDEIVAILRDCQALQIDIDQKWYQVLLEMFD